jgi:hypothetical protein
MRYSQNLHVRIEQVPADLIAPDRPSLSRLPGEQLQPRGGADFLHDVAANRQWLGAVFATVELAPTLNVAGHANKAASDGEQTELMGIAQVIADAHLRFGLRETTAGFFAIPSPPTLTLTCRPFVQ